MQVASDRYCPHCDGVVVVEGDDREGTYYYWCPTCKCGVDPVVDVDEEPREGSPEFQGTASSLAWVFAVGLVIVILVLVGFCDVTH